MAEFLSSPHWLLIQAAVVAAFVDFAFGVFAALRDGVFALDKIGAFIRKHLLGRVLPASLLIVMAYLTESAAMFTAASAALTLYATETLASVYVSLKVPGSASVPED